MGRNQGGPAGLTGAPEAFAKFTGTLAALARLTQVKRVNMSDEPIVAIGLLTSSDVERLGETFTRLWPVDETTDFSELLQAIDEAELKLQQKIRTQNG